MKAFVVGQRWISDTESELGLGIIQATDHRLVTVYFPAVEETRIYSSKNAPISRVAFLEDEIIHNSSGVSMTIERVVENKGIIIYLGKVIDTGESYAMPELEVAADTRLDKPQERLFAGQLDDSRWFGLRYESANFSAKAQSTPVRGLVGARVSLIPHQIFIAHNVGNRYAPRVLLADEVGLGKTIEAGLVLHQQIISGRTQRVLIVVPENLQHQWLVEMLRRFNLMFSLLDEERCRAIEESDDEVNPFETAQWIIVSLQFLKKYTARAEQIEKANWDLLIVDEAHHLEWTEEKASHEYQLIERLSQKAAGLLLLTATPEQLGEAGHFARLRLLDPHRFHDFKAFLQEEKKFAPIAQAARSLVENKVGSSEIEILRDILTDDDSRQRLHSLDNEENRQVIINRLIDRHGTGRILFRNTRSAIKGFPARLVKPVALPYPLEYQDPMAEHEVYAQLHPELYVSGYDAEWYRFDPRAQWLLGKLKKLKKEKVLVICSSSKTAETLEEYLRLREGIPTSVFHEGMNLIERDRAAAYFADFDYGAQVLVCSEIGSEGRNFQFAHNLVLFDLPLNPDLLEQRIGRLDRIGQKQDIEIFALYFEGSAQESLFRWYHEGLNAFEQTCADGQTLFTMHEKELLSALENHDEAKFQKLLVSTQKEHAELKLRVQEGRDYLLELNSNGKGKVEPLIETIDDIDDQVALPVYLEKLCTLFGVDIEDHSEGCLILRPGDHMHAANFPHLPEDGITITFDRPVALSREDMHFMTWEHPMMREAIDMILTQETGNATVSTLKNKAIKPGTVLVETLFHIECLAPRQLMLDMFMPREVIRLVIDPKGNDLGEKVAFHVLDGQTSNLKRETAKEVVAAQEAELKQALKRCEALAAQKLKVRVDNCLEKFNDHMTQEINRMQSLAEVNPNVRKAEIEFLKSALVEGQKYLSNTRLKLDAIRVIVAVE